MRWVIWPSSSLAALENLRTDSRESQKFRQGVGGQRGLAWRDPLKARDSGLFSIPFSLCPLRRRGTHFWRTFGVLFGGSFVANPLPPTPFRNFWESGHLRPGMSRNSWGKPKQPMKLQQPWNYDFGMFRFNFLGSQGGNSREMTTSPPRHTGERQQLHSQQPPNYKKSEPTAVKWRVRNSTRSMRFCVVSWLLSFQVPFGILWIPHRLDRMSSGQMGHSHVTNRTCPRGRLRSKSGNVPPNLFT